MRVLRVPLLHFLVGGAALFAVVRLASPPAYGARADPVIVDGADVERLRADYQRETGLAPSADDEAALVDGAVEEELLFREALARGLHHRDRSVRNWLIQQMQVLSDSPGRDPDQLYARALELGLDRSDLVVRRLLVQKMRLLAARLDEQPPGEEALRAFYAAHAADYRPPDRVSFWHVFVSSQGAAPDARAADLLARLRRQAAAPAEAARLGDSFVVPARVTGQSPAQLAKLFGASFAAALAAVEPGAWTGPLASAYGVHLVWVEARQAGAPPPLDAVRGQVLERWQSEQRRLRTARLLDELRRRHPLQIASAAWRQRRAP